MLMTAATSAEAVGYRLELGVPAEIDIVAAVPAAAWPEPLPPVVHAAIATPTAIKGRARIARTTFFLLTISTSEWGALPEQVERKLATPGIDTPRDPDVPQKGVAGA